MAAWGGLLAVLSCAGPAVVVPAAKGGQADGGVGMYRLNDAGRLVCSQTTQPLSFIPRRADVMILFDRSGSMGSGFGNNGTRYSVQAALLNDLLPVYQDKIRFGFEQFPAHGSCGADHVINCCADHPSVPLAFANAAAVNDAIELAAPVGGNTPTAEALRFARGYFDALDGERYDRYVLLSTDGRPSCTASGSLPDRDGPATDDASFVPCQDAVAEIGQLRQAGVKVIVLGVGPGLDVDTGGQPSCLQDMANQGGIVRADGSPAFFSATNPEQLEFALQEIFGGVTHPSCTIDLSQPPGDPGQVRVYLDGTQIPRSADNGWDYDSPQSPLRIRITGDFCKRLDRFQVSRVEVQFGCPPCRDLTSCE